MQGRVALCGCLLLQFGLVGCGSGAADTPAANAAQGRSGAASIGTPAEAVHKFLAAVKQGDDELASQMLTPLAREKTAEYELTVAPPGSETATYEVGEVETPGEGAAHVASKWTDIDESGKPHTDTIVWILRQEPEGWRIAGMGTKLFEDSPPLFLNFEDPEDMLRKEQLAEQEMARREKMATERQAQQPEGPGEVNR